jgi:hypothetical protein
MQTFARGAVIAAVGMLGILGASGATPQANAAGPECAADAAVQCTDQARAARPDRHAGKHLIISCSPARIGAHCMKQWVS